MRMPVARFCLLALCVSLMASPAGASTGPSKQEQAEQMRAVASQVSGSPRQIAAAAALANAASGNSIFKADEQALARSRAVLQGGQKPAIIDTPYASSADSERKLSKATAPVTSRLNIELLQRAQQQLKDVESGQAVPATQSRMNRALQDRAATRLNDLARQVQLPPEVEARRPPPPQQ